MCEDSAQVGGMVAMLCLSQLGEHAFVHAIRSAADRSRQSASPYDCVKACRRDSGGIQLALDCCASKIKLSQRRQAMELTHLLVAMAQVANQLRIVASENGQLGGS